MGDGMECSKKPKPWCQSVCLSVHVFLSHQKSQLHEILAQAVIWAWFEHDEVRFLNFSFLRILVLFTCLKKKMGFSCFFLENPSHFNKQNHDILTIRLF